MWIDKLKIAIVQKDTKNISKLLDETPKLTDVDKIKEAMFLLKEATILLQSLKDETSESMKQIKKTMDFIKSTQHQDINKLDITS